MKYLDDVKVLTDKYKLQQNQKVVSHFRETTLFFAWFGVPVVVQVIQFVAHFYAGDVFDRLKGLLGFGRWGFKGVAFIVLAAVLLYVGLGWRAVACGIVVLTSVG